MPRAHRYFVPGHVWHITHRCHRQQFLLRYAKDRARWRRWLHEAKKRHGLCVLNYVITCNHIHLLVKDTGSNVLSRSIQLIAGRTGQEYNHRKGRKGAFWEDRYHATAVEAGEHLIRCLVYIDLNMVRAGVVDHPAAWPHGGYREIQTPPDRYRVIDTAALAALCGLREPQGLVEAHRHWLEDALRCGRLSRQPQWSDSVAVGSQSFVDDLKRHLGATARGVTAGGIPGAHVLREAAKTYQINPEKGVLSRKNVYLWRYNLLNTMA